MGAVCQPFDSKRLGNEIEYMWRRPKMQSTYLFLVNRYFAFVSNIVAIVVGFETLQVCYTAHASLRAICLHVMQRFGLVSLDVDLPNNFILCSCRHYVLIRQVTLLLIQLLACCK